MRFRDVVLLPAALLLALAPVGCAPPGELLPAERGDDPAGVDTPEKGADQPDEGGDPDEEPTSGTQTVGGGDANAVVVTRPHGGAHVGRCASCGEVLAIDAKNCPGCDEPLRPWQAEQPCSACQQTGVARYVLSEELEFSEDFSRYLPSPQLPGLCRTSIEGTGFCPECVGSAVDPNGDRCLSCDGTGLVAECSGDGRDPLSLHDGDCVVCMGSGVERTHRLQPAPEEHPIVVRTRGGGTPVTGRVVLRPTVSVDIEPLQGGAPIGFPRGQLTPLSFHRAVAIHVADDDAEGHLRLAKQAMEEEFAAWELAEVRLRLARTADPTREREVKEQITALEGRAAAHRLERANDALKEGDFETAWRLAQLVRVASAGSRGVTTRAGVILSKIDQQRARADEGIDEDTRARRAAEVAKTIGVVVDEVEEHVASAQKLLADADRSPLDAVGTAKLYHVAELHAWAAERDLLRQAWRTPVATSEWPRDPVRLRDEIRELRTAILLSHAERQVQGARFGYALRLAEIAKRIEPGSSRAAQVIASAKVGLMRLGVLQGSPPPAKPR